MASVNCQAAVVTSKGSAAIAGIRIVGTGVRDVLGEIFRADSQKEPGFCAGEIYVGDIVDGGEPIDHVVVGCEPGGTFVINCHGNPLIVEMIMGLLLRCGAEPVSAEDMLEGEFSAESANAIEAEAKLAQLKSVTLEGVEIIANQVSGGLFKTVTGWIEDIESIGLEEIKEQSRQILADSEIARLIIEGCKIAIVGPPNSGKSTLLNTLCGRKKAIVTDIAGTTRDWVTASCRIDSMMLELIDTAGLDENLTVRDDIETESQDRTKNVLDSADMVLLVLDGSVEQELDSCIIPGGKTTVLVSNKSDLPQRCDPSSLSIPCSASISISAANNTGIDDLIETIRGVSQVRDFDKNRPVCFTCRQKGILEAILTGDSPEGVKTCIEQLLNGC